MSVKIIEGEEAKNIGRKEKWNILSPFWKAHGDFCMAYSTLQDGLEYFIDEDRGYIAYATLNSFFTGKGKKVALSKPIASKDDYVDLINKYFHGVNGKGALFLQTPPEVLRRLTIWV